MAMQCSMIMKKFYSVIMMLAMMIAALSFTACSSDDDELNLKQDYDILQVNGVNYACYGYRCFATYSSSWNLSTNRGTILLPCGKLSDAQKGEFDYDYMFSIELEGSKRLKKGSKLEDYSPIFESSEDYYSLDTPLEYVSGSATVTDKKDDKYLTIRFDSFKFDNGDGNSYVLNGTVQLDLDED